MGECAKSPAVPVAAHRELVKAFEPFETDAMNPPRLTIRPGLVALLLVAVAGSALADRVPWINNRVSGSPLPPPPYRAERVFAPVQFDHPVDFSAMPGSSRLFVAEQAGRLFSFQPANPKQPPALALDLRAHRRLLDSVLGFAFHPGFVTNQQIFINYNAPGANPTGSVVARFTVSTNEPPSLDSASEKIIIRWPSGGHNGCTLAFGPDGYLYVSTGDGADPDPPDGRFKTGQDNRDLLACIFRIDVDHGEGTNAYAIPRDNPFRDRADARPEIWAFGFRNPFRMAFDSETGDLWIGDVGWEQWEMIDRVERGGNYGWPITEGPNHDVRRDVAPGPGPLLPPLVALPHSEAASITGGTVYHGRKLPRLRGAYVYGDWETGKFWSLRQSAGRLESNLEMCDTALKPVAFARTHDDELLVLDYNGGVYEFSENNGAAANQAFPRALSQTGLFEPRADGTLTGPLVPSAGVLPYRVAAPMWNDHAAADWLIAVPGRETIVTAGGVGNIAGGTWVFPTNSVLARTLSLEFEAGQPASARPVETQLLHWDGQAWNPYTYRWRSDHRDADLVGPDGTNEIHAVRDPDAPGGQRVTPWRYMTRAECLRCHNAWAGETLTLNWLQLGSPDAPDSQLQTLVSAGVLRLRDAPATADTLAFPYDDTFTLAERARSWLHVNCSPCHRFGAGGAVPLLINHEKRLAETRALDTKPLRGDFGLVAARTIAPGDPFRSVLLRRIASEGAGRMPHIGSRLVDPEGFRLIRDWIESLDPTDATGTAPDSRAAATLRAEIQRQRAAVSGSNPEAAIAALLATGNGSLALLDALPDEPPSVRATAARLANSHTNLLVRDLFQRLLPPEQRRVTLGPEPRIDSILALTGDPARGRALFAGAAQCSSCHPAATGGRAFGPNLAGLGRKYSRAQILEQILVPSKIVAPEFKLVTIVTRDDRELNGFIVSRSPTELRLKDQNLVEHRLPLAAIAEQRESALSAMPEGLLAPLTAQEAADLLEHLATDPAIPKSSGP